MKLLKKNITVIGNDDSSVEVRLKKINEQARSATHMPANRTPSNSNGIGFGTTMRDYIGMLIEDKDGSSIETPVYYNKDNETCYEGESTTIVSDERLVFGEWMDLTGPGTMFVRSKIAWMEKKDPGGHLRELRRQMMTGMSPNLHKFKHGLSGIRVKEDDVESVRQDFNPLIDEDLREEASVVLETADIVIPPRPEAFDYYVQRHNDLELALDQHGFKMSQVRDGRHFRTYDIRFLNCALFNVEQNRSESVSVITQALSDACEQAGFDFNINTFPAETMDHVVWVAVDQGTEDFEGSTLSMRVSMKESTMWLDY